GNHPRRCDRRVKQRDTEEEKQASHDGFGPSVLG
ncbi:MAG: hypothetical protein ACJASJ_000039, partial [Candidatus Azotimanducaceae bacterium]